MCVWEVNERMQHRWTYRHRIIPILVLVASLAVPSVSTAPALAAPKRVTQVTVKDFSTRLVIGIVATGQILFHITGVSDQPPPRVAIDILDAVVDDAVRVTTEVKKGNVLRVRVGQFQDSPPIARVVVDLIRPVQVEVERAAPNILAVSVPIPPTPAQSTAQAPAPAVSAALGTGVVKTAQQPIQPPGIIRLLEFRGVALSDVLSALAKLCGFNLVTDASVQGTITLRLVDVTCEDALRYILEANNLAFRRLGRNIIIGSAEKLAPPPEVPETIAYRLAYGDVNQIRAAVAAAVPGIRVAVDPRTNALLITGTTAQHQDVMKVLQTLDVKIPQVVIQVHAIEISSSVLRQLGLFGGLGNDLLNPAGVESFGRAIVDSAQNRISLSVVNSTLMFFRLQALVTENNARILAAPRIATLDGNKASILLGSKEPIFTITTQGGVTTTTVSFIDVGVKMEVTPRVNADGVITLAIKPEVSAIAATVTGPGGQQAPRVTTRSADTILEVKDGQTLVLGGLINREERESLTKVPLLGDIPVLGELFRFRSTDTRESEVIFLITPSIMLDGGQQGGP